MKPIRLCAALLLGTFLIPATILPVTASFARVARADDDLNAVTATLKEIYSTRDGLFKKRDFDAVLTYESADYTEIDAKGKTLQKADADAHFKEQMAQLPELDNIETKLDEVTIGDEGTTAQTTTVVEINLPSPDGGTHKLVITNKSTDVWVKNPGAKEGEPAMLLLKTTEKETKGTLDGNPFDLGDG